MWGPPTLEQKALLNPPPEAMVSSRTLGRVVGLSISPHLLRELWESELWSEWQSLRAD